MCRANVINRLALIDFNKTLKANKKVRHADLNLKIYLNHKEIKINKLDFMSSEVEIRANTMET